jgi:hypothetical protein
MWLRGCFRGSVPRTARRICRLAPAPGVGTTSQHRFKHPQGVQFKPVLMSKLIPVASGKKRNSVG